MAAKKRMAGQTGGAVMLLGSLVYLYVFFTWYSSGALVGPWISAAAFLGPFVIAGAIVSAITLFFFSVGSLSGRPVSEMMRSIIWRFVIMSGGAFFILTGGGSLFLAAILGFIITYIGALGATM